MTNLKSVLAKYVPDARNLGTQLDPTRRDRLQDELKKLKSDLRTAWRIRLGAAIIVFVFLLGVGIYYIGSPTVLAGIFSAVGVTFAGALAMMQKVSDDMTRVGMLILIVPELELKEIAKVAHTLVSKLN